MMVSKLITCTGCALMALGMTAPAAMARRPSSPPKHPAPPATPAAETPQPPVETATPEAPVRVGQEAEWSPEEAPRVFQGTLAPPEPEPAPARPLPRAPVRLPSTGPGDHAVPLAGAALALGGLALVAAQPRHRPRLRASATPGPWTAKISAPSGSTFPTPS